MRGVFLPAAQANSFSSLFIPQLNTFRLPPNIEQFVKDSDRLLASVPPPKKLAIMGKSKNKSKKREKRSKPSAKKATPITTAVSETSGWNHLELHKDSDSKFAIVGNESQVLTVALQNGETVQGEPGTMMLLSPGVTQRVSYEGCCARMLSGEDCFVVNFTNTGVNGIGYAHLTPNEPLGKVIPVDLSSPQVNGALIAQQGTYMGSSGDVSVSFSCDFNFMRCCCGGVGLVRQKIVGSGTVFLGATGTIVQKMLGPGEVMVIDTNCILAFSESCKLDIKRAGGILGMAGGGEGIFNTTLTGPGLAIVQSMNHQMFLDALAANKIYRR